MNTMKKHLKGFTLIELMIVVAVVGILAAIAYPAYQSQLRDARRADGQEMLLQVMSQQERFYTENNTYTTTLTDLGYGSNTDVATGDGFYLVNAIVCVDGGGNDEPLTACVNITATAQGAQVADGNLALDSRNNREGEW